MNILDLKTPVWFMRQAGRHLPEYREIRSKKKSFLEFCFDKKSIVEATLQPIRRYKIDCAIIFCDILIVPYILGQKISFVKGEGPLLENLSLEKLTSLKPLTQKEKDLQNTYNAIKEIRKKLIKNKSLIGFCGGPWTVACYMINGKSDSKFKNAIEKIGKEKELLDKLLDKLIDLSVTHLYQQYISGCDTLMIFESWAGLVPKKEFKDILTDPVNKIIKKLKLLGVLAPIIVLPRGINEKIIDYIDAVKMDIISVDYNIDIGWLIKNLKTDIILQGNIDPNKIEKGGKELEAEVNRLLLSTKERKHIYCSGHGLLPSTPIKNVERVIEIIKEKHVSHY